MKQIQIGKIKSLPPNETIDSLQVDLLHLDEKLPVKTQKALMPLVGEILSTETMAAREQSPMAQTI